jgi:hypothetical protein
MRRHTILLALFGLALPILQLAAQPNLTGHWVEMVTGAGPGIDGGRGRGGGGGNPQGAGAFGRDFRIVHDGNAFTIRRVDTQTGDTLSVTYRIGEESLNRALFGGGFQPARTVSTAVWNRDRLVITSYPADSSGARGNAGGTSRPTIANLWMSGRQLRVQTDRPGTNGGNDTGILTIYNKRND